MSARRFVVGTVAWILGAHYFAVEALVQRAWVEPPYSLRYNTISDLGATLCGPLPILNTVVCSPLHALMNLSFVLTGVLTMLGAFLLRPYFPRNRAVTLSLLVIGAAALGSIVVGLFPENEHPIPHFVGALTLLVLGNAGLLALGATLYFTSRRKRYAALTIALGGVGLAGFLLLPLGFLPFVGIGFMERVAAYPLTVWIVASGVLFLRGLKKASDSAVRPVV